jgi:hypothetical protein
VSPRPARKTLRRTKQPTASDRRRIERLEQALAANLGLDLREQPVEAVRAAAENIAAGEPVLTYPQRLARVERAMGGLGITP